MEALSPFIKKVVEAVAFGIAAVATAVGTAAATGGEVSLGVLASVFLTASAGKYVASQTILK